LEPSTKSSSKYTESQGEEAGRITPEVGSVLTKSSQPVVHLLLPSNVSLPF